MRCIICLSDVHRYRRYHRKQSGERFIYAMCCITYLPDGGITERINTLDLQHYRYFFGSGYFDTVVRGNVFVMIRSKKFHNLSRFVNMSKISDKNDNANKDPGDTLLNYPQMTADETICHTRISIKSNWIISRGRDSSGVAICVVSISWKKCC